MKTFKQFMTEVYDFNKTHHMGMNDPREVADFSTEAHRQINNFGKRVHEDFDDGTKPPKPIHDEFYDEHKLKRHWSLKEIEDNPEEAARHLDLYHHHYPEIAKHYNMRPMMPEVSDEHTPRD